MKTSPIEIARLFYAEKKTKFQICALLNVPLFYVEKCVDRYTQTEIDELEKNKQKAIESVVKKAIRKRKMAKVTDKAGTIFIRVERCVGHKDSAYYENEMEYGRYKNPTPLPELIEKFN